MNINLLYNIYDIKWVNKPEPFLFSEKVGKLKFKTLKIHGIWGDSFSSN